MRIAQIAPLSLPIPPPQYGGIERVVSYLTEAIVDLGHDVTLFASGDSKTKANLVPICEHAHWLDSSIKEPLAHQLALMEVVRRRASDFDVLHFHTNLLHYSLFDRQAVPYITTIHMPPLPEWLTLLGLFNKSPLVAISHNQRDQIPSANWCGVVHNGLPVDLLNPLVGISSSPPYLAFLGTISPEKGTHNAIEIAIKSGILLKIAAQSIDTKNKQYFDEKIAPFLSPEKVNFIGEISDSEKSRFLSGALALLVPVEFNEPFGLVMIEAMACGTPVVGFRRGAVPEIVEDGITGYVVGDVAEAQLALLKVHLLSRSVIRERFEVRFSATMMAKNYLALYESLA